LDVTFKTSWFSESWASRRCLASMTPPISAYC
jgi:hypothetical protein